MFKLGVPLLFLSLLLDGFFSELLITVPHGSLISSSIVFLVAIIVLYRVKNDDYVLNNVVFYSEEYKAKSLAKFTLYWLVIALFIDVLFAVLVDPDLWSDINPFDSNLLFLVLFFVSVFSSSLKIVLSPNQCKVQCSRLGFVTSNILNFKDIKLIGEQLIIISQDDGKFIFNLDRFAPTKRNFLVESCKNMPNKPLKQDK